MRTRAFGWVSALICVLYLFQAVLVPLYAADAAKGEPVAVGGDVGEPVAPSAKKETQLWPWVLGALVAGLGGWIVGDQLNDDDGASDAEKAAADAEKAAAAAAAGDGAATAAAASPTYKVFISGTFQGTDPGTGNNVGIIFSVANLGADPGGISNYLLSSTGALTGNGGRYDQAGKNTVFIQLDDSYYVGVAVVVSESQIRLQNGTLLIAQSGAKAQIVQMPSE